MSPAMELWLVFWNACKETPKGMVMPYVAFYRCAKQNWNAKSVFSPFVALWQTALNNPILEKSDEHQH